MRTLRFRAAKKQGGYSLMELGFALLLVSMIGYYIIDDYIANQEKVTIKREIDAIHQIISGTMETYSSEQDFANVNVDYLRQGGVFPKWMISGTEIRNSAKGLVTVAPVSISSANDGVQFTETNFTIGMCQKVLRRVESGVRSLTVNGKEVKPMDGQLDGKALGENCKSGLNTISFQISK